MTDLDRLIVDRDALWWTPEGFVEGCAVEVREEMDFLAAGTTEVRYCWTPEGIRLMTRAR